MRAEIRAALAETGEAPATDADLINSIYHSLAYCYGEAYREMEAGTNCTSQAAAQRTPP